MKLIAAFAAAALLTAPAFSAPCRDAKGHFAKCPTSAANAPSALKKDAKGRCHDAKGHFAKC